MSETVDVMTCAIHRCTGKADYLLTVNNYKGTKVKERRAKYKCRKCFEYFDIMLSSFGIKANYVLTNAKPWRVYMVECKDGSLYTGVSTDVESRVTVHNKGTGAKYTKSRRPVRLVYTSGVMSKSEALKTEIKIKKLPASSKRELC